MSHLEKLEEPGRLARRQAPGGRVWCECMRVHVQAHTYGVGVDGRERVFKYSRR